MECINNFDTDTIITNKERRDKMRKNLMITLAIAAAVTLGIIIYAMYDDTPQVWENSAFVTGARYGDIY